MEPRFLVDLNVGRLAKWLRAMGYDTRFMPNADDRELVNTALREKRTLLTRDALILQRRVVTSGQLRVLLVQGHKLRDQLQHVVKALSLNPNQEFSRCIQCNVLLVSINKEDVSHRIPPFVYETQDQFMECPACHRLYWHGTHWYNMRIELQKALSNLP